MINPGGRRCRKRSRPRPPLATLPPPRPPAAAPSGLAPGAHVVRVRTTPKARARARRRRRAELPPPPRSNAARRRGENPIAAGLGARIARSARLARIRGLAGTCAPRCARRREGARRAWGASAARRPRPRKRTLRQRRPGRSAARRGLRPGIRSAPDGARPASPGRRSDAAWTLLGPAHRARHRSPGRLLADTVPRAPSHGASPFGGSVEPRSPAGHRAPRRRAFTPRLRSRPSPAPAASLPRRIGRNAAGSRSPARATWRRTNQSVDRAKRAGAEDRLGPRRCDPAPESESATLRAPFSTPRARRCGRLLGRLNRVGTAARGCRR